MARVHAANDFELVVRSAKELEHVLEAEFGATGKGVHEKVCSYPPPPSIALR